MATVTSSKTTPASRVNTDNGGSPRSWQTPGTFPTATASSGSGATDFLDLTNFGFTLPAGSIVRAVRVTLGLSQSGASGTVDNDVHLLKNGSPVGTNKAVGNNLNPTTSTDKIFGDLVSDLWGTTWTWRDINSTSFGARFAAYVTNAGQQARVHSVTVEVVYDEPAAYPALPIRSKVAAATSYVADGFDVPFNPDTVFDGSVDVLGGFLNPVAVADIDGNNLDGGIFAGFALGLPDDAIIRGVVFRFYGGGVNLAASVCAANITGGLYPNADIKSLDVPATLDLAAMTKALNVVTLGGSSDLWGHGPYELTKAAIADAGFGLQIDGTVVGDVGALCGCAGVELEVFYQSQSEVVAPVGASGRAARHRLPTTAEKLAWLRHELEMDAVSTQGA